MWVWLYGLCISFFLILNELEVTNITSLIPLIVLCLLAFVKFISRLFQFPHLHLWSEWINTGFLFCLSAVLLTMVSLHVYGVINYNTFFTVFTITVAFISIIFLVVRGSYAVFLNTPARLRISYAVSYASTVSAYLCFYGVEYNHIEAWVPLIPFVISMLSEMFIFWTFYNGIPELQYTFTKNTAMDRLTYVICVSILLICALVHYAVRADDLLLYISSATAYFIGIIVVLTRSRKGFFKNWPCCTKAKYIELKSDDINPEEGVTNNGNE